MKICPHCKNEEGYFIRKGLAICELQGYFNSIGQWETGNSEYHEPEFMSELIECEECHKKFKFEEMIENTTDKNIC